MRYRLLAITLGFLFTLLASTLTRAEDTNAVPEHFLRCDVLTNPQEAEDVPWPVVIVCQIIDEGNPFSIRGSFDEFAVAPAANNIDPLLVRSPEVSTPPDLGVPPLPLP